MLNRRASEVHLLASKEGIKADDLKQSKSDNQAYMYFELRQIARVL